MHSIGKMHVTVLDIRISGAAFLLCTTHGTLNLQEHVYTLYVRTIHTLLLSTTGTML